jgi:hypothetical protein
MAGLIYSLVAVYIINPENKHGNVEFKEGNKD